MQSCMSMNLHIALFCALYRFTQQLAEHWLSKWPFRSLPQPSRNDNLSDGLNVNVNLESYTILATSQQVSSTFAGHGPQNCVFPFFLSTCMKFKHSTEFGYTSDLSLDNSTKLNTQPCKRNGDCPQNTKPPSNLQTTTPTNGICQNGVNSACDILNVMSLLVTLWWVNFISTHSSVNHVHRSGRTWSVQLTTAIINKLLGKWNWLCKEANF